MEEEVYKNPWFIKHVPVPERPAKISELEGDGLKYYENDFKAFESHFTPEIMRICELKLYRYLLSDYPEDAEYICSVIGGRNNLSTNTGVKFSLDARRMSGDMCTSLGNGFTNLCLILYICFLKGAQVKGFVEGDDGLFATTATITKQDYLDLGFTVEIHQVPRPTDAHFCGCTCSTDGNLLKDPRRVFQNFGWTHSFIHAGNQIMDELLRSKALNLSYEMSQCPIVRVLADVALELTKDVIVKHTEKTYNPVPESFTGPVPYAPTYQTRSDFARLFGVSIPAQLAIEDAILRHDLVTVSLLLPPLSDPETGRSDLLDYSARYIEVT